jgi:hypothetical protein
MGQLARLGALLLVLAGLGAFLYYQREKDRLAKEELAKKPDMAETMRRTMGRPPIEESPVESELSKLKATAATLRQNNQLDQLKDVEAKIAEIEAKLDQDYLAKMPPFKFVQFAGRKGKSDRVAVMELFTGAQCPPCVAADVAFDALEKTYKPADVILLQYHMHIPGPDALTNPDDVSRWDYYREKFPQDIGGTPSTLFNGHPQHGGGGSMDGAEGKYQEYRGAIDSLLEKQAPARLTLKANRHGDQIDIKAQVAALPEPNAKKRLRFVLVEERIGYVGSNRLRFHHHVVRALPGGAAGLALTEKDSEHTVSLNTQELRQQLEKYLDEYAKKRPFPTAQRPLDFKDLKVVALIQDDATREILQAAQVDVDDEATAQLSNPNE